MKIANNNNNHLKINTIKINKKYNKENENIYPIIFTLDLIIILT